MRRGFVKAGFTPLVAALACAPRVELEHPTPPAAEVSEASEPACSPISLDEAAEITVALMERRNWRHDPNEGWIEASSAVLAFDNVPSIASVTFGLPSSSEELDAALTLPTGAGHADLEPLTDELVGIGERAMGFSVMRVVYDDHPRGTRRREWKYSAINFVRCGVFVHVGAEFEADHVLPIAREIDEWLAERACC
jgi:hypothetical protein